MIIHAAGSKMRNWDWKWWHGRVAFRNVEERHILTPWRQCSLISLRLDLISSGTSAAIPGTRKASQIARKVWRELVLGFQHSACTDNCNFSKEA